MYIFPVLMPADVMWPAAWVSVLTSTKWWTLVWNFKPNKPFQPHVAFCCGILSRHQKGSYDGDKEGDWRQMCKVSCAGVIKEAIDSTMWFSTFTCTHVTSGHQNMWLSPTVYLEMWFDPAVHDSAPQGCPPLQMPIPSLTLWPMLPSTNYCQYKYTALTLQQIKYDLFWC